MGKPTIVVESLFKSRDPVDAPGTFCLHFWNHSFKCNLMYKSNSINRGKLTGKKYRFFPGWKIDAPNGDLYGLPGVEWIGKGKEKKPKALPTVETIIHE